MKQIENGKAGKRENDKGKKDFEFAISEGEFTSVKFAILNPKFATSALIQHQGRKMKQIENGKAGKRENDKGKKDFEFAISDCEFTSVKFAILNPKFAILLSYFLFFWLAVYSGAPLLAAKVERVHITLKTNVGLSQRDVRLGDLATVACQDQSLADRVRNIKMGHTPWPGNMRRIDSDIFRMRLRHDGISLRRVDFSGADSVLLSVRSVKLPGQKIADFAKRYLRSRLPWASDEVVVELRGAPQDIVLPAPPEPGKWGSDIQTGIPFLLYASPINGSKRKGDILVEVSVYLRSGASYEEDLRDGALAKPRTDGPQVSRRDKLLLKAPVHFYVRVFGAVVMAKRSIQRSESFSDKNISVGRAELTALVGSPFYSDQELVGKVATQPIRALNIVTRGMVDCPALIKRRDVVTVIVANGALEITTKGQALEDGRRGDIIRVRNLLSRKEVLAKVMDPRRVRAIF